MSEYECLVSIEEDEDRGRVSFGDAETSSA